MQKINFQNLPSTSTPINATNLNAIQTNVENVFNGIEPMGNVVVDSIRSKNMFDKNSMVYTRNGYLPFDTSNTRLANFGGVGPATLVIKLEAGKTYTMSKIAGARFRAGFTNTPTPPLDTDNVITRIPNNDTGTSMTFTVPSGNVYFVCNFFSQDQTVDANIGYENMLNTIQIEEGTTATSYSPYQGLGYVSGSNANGNYIKYDDGTLICWNRIVVSSVAITSAEGSLYKSDNITPFPDYPIPFVNDPSLSMESISDDNTKWFWIVKSVGDSIARIRGIRLFSATSTTLVNAKLSYIAIGRWK